MHRLKIFIFVGMIFGLSSLWAQTDIPDQTEVSGVWDVSGSPYRINGEAIVPQGGQLVIRAGVRVEFKTGTQHEYVNPLFDLGLLRVKGCLKVDGEAGNPVLFTRQGASGNWGVLFFDETSADSSYLRFVQIEYASFVQYLQNWMDYYGALSVVNAPLTIENCQFMHNANDGVFAKEAPLVLRNCLIADNGQNGLRTLSQSDVQLVNCTVVDNAVAGFDCGVNSFPQIINSIFWHNKQDFVPGNYSQIRLSYSMIQNKELDENVLAGEGIILGKNPNFKNAAQGDYHLAFNSFAVNNGDADTTQNAYPRTDLDGQARIIHGRIDIGAYELNGHFLRLTRPNGDDSFIQQTVEPIRWQTDLNSVDLAFSTDDGQSWQSIATIENSQNFNWTVPTVTSEQCLLRVNSSDEPAISDLSDTTFIIDDHAIIRDGRSVAGTWEKSMSPVEVRGKVTVPADSTLRIEPGVRVELQAGSRFNVQASDFNAGLFLVKGHLIAFGAENDTIVFTANGSGNWGALVFDRVDSSFSRLKFVKIEKAHGVDSLFGQNYPAALGLNEVSFEISHCRLTSNAASGILLNGDSHPHIHHCQIEDNEASGLLIQGASRFSKPEIDQNRLKSNGRHGIHLKDLTAAYVHDNVILQNDSTGVYLETGYATPVIENNRIGEQITGIYCDNTAPKLVGDVLYRNTTGIYLNEASPDMGNVTFAHNNTAIYCKNASPIITNALFGYNDLDFDFYGGDNSAPKISYSMTNRAFWGIKITDGGFNRMNASPVFSGSGEHPYAVGKGSAAIDNGTTDNLLITLPEFDVAGHPRILDGNHDGNKQVDIGAYEFAELSAGFEASPTSGKVPLTVQFSDQSVGEIEYREWNFGDGATSNDENPTHVYSKAGRFSVRLIVQGPVGRDTLLRKDYIYGKYPPFVCRNLSDTSFAEDSGWHFVAELTSVFCDSDSTSQLSFNAMSSSKNIQTRLQNDSLFVGSAANFAGEAQIAVKAEDILNLSVSDTFQVTIKQVNDAPYHRQPLPDSLTFTNDSTYILKIWDYYADIETPDSLLRFSFALSKDSVLVKYDSTSGILSIWTDLGFSGRAELFITVQDDSGATLQDTIHLLMESPTAVQQTLNVPMPDHFFLEQNYPNPFNPTTTVRYGLPKRQKITVLLFDVLGRYKTIIPPTVQKAGVYSIKIDAGKLGLSSGIYFLLLHSEQFNRGRKIILIK